MKKAITLIGIIGVFIWGFVLTTCDNTGGSVGTLTVEIAGCPSGAEACKLYLELYAAGADPLSSSLLATGSILLGTEESVVIKDPLSDEDIVLDAGEYDLYLWIDMNDNIDTVQEPELGTDMAHVSCPIRITIDRDTRLVITGNSIELFYGWSGIGLSGCYIYASVGSTAYEWKHGDTGFQDNAFGIVVSMMGEWTILYAAPETTEDFTNADNYVLLYFLGTTTGIYTEASSQCMYVIDGVEWTFTDITLNVTTYEDVGGVIAGTFSGTVADGSTNTMTVEDGQFKVIHAPY